MPLITLLLSHKMNLGKAEATYLWTALYTLFDIMKDKNVLDILIELVIVYWIGKESIIASYNIEKFICI